MNAIAHVSATPLSGPKLDNRRMLAGLIDLLIVGVGGAAILAAAGVIGGGGVELSAPLLAVAVSWALYYYFACESGAGQTVGKKLMRIRVVRVDGRPAGIGDVAVRSALRVVDTALLGLVVMLATGERRGRLGDLAAGTMVVSVDEGAGPAPAKASAVAVAAEEAPVAVAEEAPVAMPAEEPPVVTAAEAPAIESPEQDFSPEPPAVEAPEPPELRPFEPVAEVPEADELEADEPPLDFASPSLKELAEDVAAATGSRPTEEPVVEAEPVAQAVPVVEDEPVVEVASEEPEVSVKSVETVSAIDLIMGADESDQDPAASDEPSPDALPQ